MQGEDSTTQVLGYGSQIGLDTEHATPPVNAYIGVDDVLGLAVGAGVASLIVTVFARVLLPDGTIVPNQWQVTAPIQRALFNFSFQLPEGFLLSVTANINGSNGPGSQYLKLYLTRGTTATGPVTQVLAASYCSTTTQLTWPYGPIKDPSEGRGLIRSITGTLQAAGTDLSETVPANAKWRLQSIRYSIATSAAVANRTSTLVIDDGTNVLFMCWPNQVIVAGLTAFFNWGELQASGALNQTQQSAGFPSSIMLLPGWRIRSNTFSLQAADQVSAPQYSVEEWIYP